MSRIKICGLRREEDIRFANEIQPDFVGFVFAPSKRKVTVEEAQRLRQLLRPEIPAVGVFVNASEEEILEPVRRQVIQMIQLHGQESTDFVQQIRAKTGLPVIQAVSVKKREDILRCRELKADYLLLDQGAGGTGKAFDWSLLTGETERSELEQIIGKSFFLAGGISAQNVEEAIARFHPFAVDASSSVETDGVKNFEKMKELTELVRKI
ncbi:MAG: phosphoribosylanthranilate isomerase [Lachnospiraceae bacterium]|nr:phosphoribosylanthranilate isomerase [Lachnospiraceae bacterium]